MKKTLISLLSILIFTAGSLAFAQEDVYRTEYVARDTEGKKRWQANIEIRKKEGNVYILMEKGEGIYSSFKGPISWVAQMEFENTEKNIIPLKLVKRVYDKDGTMIRLEEQDYDPIKKSVICTHEDIPKNIIRKKKFKFTKDAVNRLLLGLYVRKFLAIGKRSSKIQMVSEEPGFYNIDLSVVSTENVDINGRTIDAYKIQLDPRLGLLDVVKVFLPKAYAWHSAKPQFEWLKYEGLECGVNSEKIEVTTRD